MCRLFGMHAGSPVRATFWLLDAPDSLAAQSHRAPDGAGIGVFTPGGRPEVDKAPMAAWQDRQFATEARELTSAVFVAHVRYASTGGLTVANTHPFTQDGAIFAHNGAFTGLDRLDRRLVEVDAQALVHGDTDSERMFALISAEIRRHHGDVEAGLTAAVTWIADTLPTYCLNLLLATPGRLWALRYPATNGLYILRREPGGHGRAAALDAASDRIHARSPGLAAQAATVVASEPMDADPGWRSLDPGELVRIDADQTVHSSFPMPERLARPLTVADLSPVAASSQLASPPTRTPPST